VIGGDESLGDDELELRPDVLRAWVREGKSVFRPGGA
jgi:hypothetical protein